MYSPWSGVGGKSLDSWPGALASPLEAEKLLSLDRQGRVNLSLSQQFQYAIFWPMAIWGCMPFCPREICNWISRQPLPLPLQLPLRLLLLLLLLLLTRTSLSIWHFMSRSSLFCWQHSRAHSRCPFTNSPLLTSSKHRSTALTPYSHSFSQTTALTTAMQCTWGVQINACGDREQNYSYVGGPMKTVPSNVH